MGATLACCDGLFVENRGDGGEPQVFARGRSDVGLRLECGAASRAVRSFYHRCLADLPVHGRRVLIQVRVRRFRCLEPRCIRRRWARPPCRGSDRSAAAGDRQGRGARNRGRRTAAPAPMRPHRRPILNRTTRCAATKTSSTAEESHPPERSKSGCRKRRRTAVSQDRSLGSLCRHARRSACFEDVCASPRLNVARLVRRAPRQVLRVRPSPDASVLR